MQTSAARLDVAQSSERLGIEWRDFSIGRGEQVHFDQPSRSAIALNRVTGPRLSNIEGSLTANGNVFLVNRNGVVFRRSAMVDVGGLLATTVDVSNQDFLAGRYRFAQNPDLNGQVVNEGRIKVAEGGLVALVAPGVRNAGVIEARLGRVALASGSTFTLDLYGDELVTFAIDDPLVQRLAGPNGALVDQSGTIDAPGGRVWLTANAARDAVDGAINLSGVVRARTTSNREGLIVLKGGGGSVRVAGTLDATGGSGDRGGQIEVLGESVQLASPASLDVSGGIGGGTVLVGGDYQGRGTRQRAARTEVNTGAAIRADASVNGDGGTIVIWSDERTGVDGALSARGGPAGGNGGLIETSSAGALEFSVPVKVSAPRGRAGTWLLDPEDIDIDRGKADSIEDTLNEGGNVSIRTSDQGDGDGNISVNASITKTDGDDARLSMTAHGKIDVNQPIRSEEGKLDVSLKAGTAVNVKAGVETNGGSFSSSVTGVKEPGPEPGADPGDTDDGAGAGESDDPPDTHSGATDVAGTEPGAKNPVEGTPEEHEPGDNEPVAQLAGNDDADKDTAEAGSSDGIESVEHVAATAGPSADQIPGRAPPVITVEDTVATKGGDISVDAGETGAALVTGVLDSSNLDEGETGGDIEVLGKHVVVAGDAVVDASGEAGGGDIHIGGDYQGEGERRNAETTTIGTRVVIRSDATGDGDAGTVVVWADGTARFQGSISARGGPEGGDGGLVEVSGKKDLGFTGTVDAGSPAGNPGTLLLDPETLRIIDARRGKGELDLELLCTASTDICAVPAKVFLPPPGVPDDLLFLFVSPAQLAALGIDPDPETPLNTVSWGRLIQLAGTTGPGGSFGIRLEAEQDITFAPLNGTMSTRGSPAGSDDGWTVTLALADPATVRDSELFNALRVTSHHGSIMFEDPSDNLAVRGGVIVFEAPEGELRLGNLYGLGPVEEITGDTSWRFSSVLLLAGGDIRTGALNTRIQPDRLADPVTGAPQPQPLVISNPSTFDPNSLRNSELLSDLDRGGSITIRTPAGNIDIMGPVHTGTGRFVAQAGGTFTATNIDTGANRLYVKSSEDDNPGSLNTLHSGDVNILANRIVFDRINAGSVTLEALTHAQNAITGQVVFDTFRNSDFIGGRPESEGLPFRPSSDPGLTLTVRDDGAGTCGGNCIDGLTFNLFDLSRAEVLGLNSGDTLDDADATLLLAGMVQQDLGGGFTFQGGDIPVQTRHVPQALVIGPLNSIAPPGALPIAVPLNLPSQSGPATGSLPLPVSLGSPPGATPPTVAGGGPPPVVFVETASSAEVERIGNESKKQKSQSTSGCSGADRLEWLALAADSAARAVDWGRRSGIGTDPEDTENVFQPSNCHFSSAQ